MTAYEAYTIGFQAAVICHVTFIPEPFFTDDKVVFQAWCEGYNFGLWIKHDMPSLMVH